MNELVKAKAKLYRELMLVDPDHISDADVALMEALSKDPDIQKILSGIKP